MTGQVELKNLSKSYGTPKGPARIVEGFNLLLHTGEFVSIIGHSGCGKSTVLSMVAGLLSPSSGTISVGGKSIDGPGTDRGMVFQSPSLLPWLTVLQNVLLGIRQVAPDLSRQHQEERAQQYLEWVGLADEVHQRPCQLSGGMRQRVGLARAFALAPKVLLLDEPFGMLDALTRLELQEVLMRIWHQQRMTTLMVTHDVDEALFLSDRIVLMTRGPASRIGDIVEVPFPRPRQRMAVLEDAVFYPLRERLLSFLETQEIEE